MFEECVTGTLTDLAARYADAPPKGEIVVIVGPPGEVAVEAADDATLDAALREAMADKPVAQAAKAVAKRLDRKSTRLNSVTNAHLVCRLLLEKKKKLQHRTNQI